MGRLGASGTQPPVTAACQKELAKPRQTKFRTEIPSIPLRGKIYIYIYLMVDVKAKTRKSMAILLIGKLNILTLGWWGGGCGLLLEI